MGGNFKMIDLKTKSIIRDFAKLHAGGVYAIEVTKNNKYVYSADFKGHVNQINVRNHKITKNWLSMGNRRKGIRSMKISADSSRIYVSGDSGELRSYDIEKMQLIKDYGYLMTDEVGIWSMAESKDWSY